MSFKPSRVKVPLGMRVSNFYPIASEPANARPVYEAAIDMGASVKGYLTVVTATASVPGDDINQIEAELFVSGQLDAETALSDLEVNAKIYGHSITEEGGEISRSGDQAIYGGYSYIEPILTKEQETVYRATALLKVKAITGSEKQEADTKKSGELSFKNNAVSYKVYACETSEWRIRNDFDSQPAAEAFLAGIFAAVPSENGQQNS